MATKDLKNHLTLVKAIAPVVVADNTAQVSDIIDTAGFESLVFGIILGALADADATFAVLVEDGGAADLSDAAAVADAQLVGTEAETGFTFADDRETRKIGYVGNKRYVRLTITLANNAGNAPLAALAILGHGREQPVA
jgi:hypothetical protein